MAAGSTFKCHFFTLVIIVCCCWYEAAGATIPKFETSKNAILKKVPIWLTPLFTNDQNLKLALDLLNCSFTVRNISQCGSNYLDGAKTTLTSAQKSSIVAAAGKYLLAVGAPAYGHIDLLCNILYDGVKVPIWDKSQALANKYKTFATYKIYAANMLNKAFNEKLVCKIAADVKTKFGAKAWQAAKDNFGNIAVMIKKCSL